MPRSRARCGTLSVEGSATRALSVCQNPRLARDGAPLSNALRRTGGPAKVPLPNSGTNSTLPQKTSGGLPPPNIANELRVERRSSPPRLHDARARARARGERASPASRGESIPRRIRRRSESGFDSMTHGRAPARCARTFPPFPQRRIPRARRAVRLVRALEGLGRRSARRRSRSSPASPLSAALTRTPRVQPRLRRPRS